MNYKDFVKKEPRLASGHGLCGGCTEPMIVKAVLGATDNFLSRKIIDKYTKQLSIPFVHGSIEEFQGQVTVFNYKGGKSYFDLFPETPPENKIPIGVMGILPGVIGSLQAAEAVKILTGIGTVLSEKLLIYDALEANFLKVEY